MKFTQITNTSEFGTLKPHWNGWLQERFPGHFAQIGTINTLRLKNSVRDVARFLLGSVPPEIEYLCKGFPVPPQGVSDEKFLFGYDTDEGHIPGRVETDTNLQEYIKKYPDHWKIVVNCLALWRSRGRHAAGYVISNEPIDEFIPTSQVGGVKVLDYTGPECEAAGAIKYDFLVVNSVRDVQSCVQLVQNRHLGGMPKDQKLNGLLVPGLRIVPDKEGKLHDIWDLPQDPEVFKDLDAGKVETVFQFDSGSARQWLKYFKGIINSISDMAVFTALDRPGPLDYLVKNPDNPTEQINMLVEYSRRAKGLKGSEDIVKELDTLCAETKGIMIYQESLMRVYQYFTGCTLAEAEEFRGNVGKKKKDKIEKAYKLFMERAVAKVSRESAQRVWDSIITFSAYGFNRCLSTDTPISDSFGRVKKLSQFKPGDDVIYGRDSNGELIDTKVVALHDHGVLPGFEVTFTDGYSVICSINHKFLTSKGQQPLYKILYENLWIVSLGYNEYVQIAKIDAVGPVHMMDLEVDHPEHNFMLPNGVITSNSHAQSYTTLSYTCLWLKHYYPLEWWCAVLQNASKDDINDKFWQYCGDLVLLPDISLSKGTWEIEGDKIRAPVSMLTGIGETAHEQLSYGAPYASLEAFCKSIISWQKKRSTVKEEVDKDGNVTKVRVWGRNSLDIGKIQAMLIAGCMDSLFEPDTTISAKLDQYHATMKRLYAEEGKKYAQSKKKLPTLDALGRYQAKKAVLPPYGEDLRKTLRAIGLPDYIKEYDANHMTVKAKVWSSASRQEIDTFEPLIGADDWLDLENSQGYMDRAVKCGIVAYIEEKAPFTKVKDKNAVELIAEFGGIKRKFTCWPDQNNLLPAWMDGIMSGAIAALVVEKRPGKPFYSVRYAHLIKGPLEKENKDVKGKQE